MTQKELSVFDAGAVLLAPFLPTLFSDFKLLSQKGFRNTAGQLKAIDLLNYAVQGVNKPASHTNMSAILCGCRMRRPKKRMRISHPEASEINALLGQVINQWSVLKSTSVDSLRHTFLQREGRLIENTAHYDLLVERKSQDILLDSLPWNFTFLKLTWMDKPVLVEW